MKRIKKFTLILSCCVILSACGNATPANTGSAHPVSQEAQESTISQEQITESCKKAFQSLNTAADTTTEIMNVVEKAWYYSIYYDDICDKLGQSKLNRNYGYGYSDYTGLDWAEVKSAMDSILEENGSGSFKEQTFMYHELNYCFACAIRYYSNNGILSETQALLDSTKTLIKDISNMDSNCKYLEELKLYYSDINAGFEYIQKPTGSYKDLIADNSNYQEKFQTHRNSLSFDLE